MQIYAYNHTIEKKGTLILKEIPFNVGEKVDIIIPRPSHHPDNNPYPFRGKPITYPNPTEPLAESDWEILR